MNPIDQLIDSYMAEGMTETKARNQVKEDVLKGREKRKESNKGGDVRDEFFESLEQMIKDLENDDYSEYLIWNISEDSNRKTAVSALKELRNQFVDKDAEIYINGHPVINPEIEGAEQ